MLDPSKLPATLSAAPRIVESAAIRTRRLTLDEQQNILAESMGMLLNKTAWRNEQRVDPLASMITADSALWFRNSLPRRSSRLHLQLLRDSHSLAPRCFCCITCVACGELEFLNGAGWLLLLLVTNFARAAKKGHDIFGIHADATAYKGLVVVWNSWRERR